MPAMRQFPMPAARRQVRAGFIRIQFENRQNQDLRDFMIWQDWEISILERFQSW